MYLYRFREVNKGAQFLSSPIESLVLMNFNITFPLYIIFFTDSMYFVQVLRCEKGNDIIVEDNQCSGTVQPSVFWKKISSNSVLSLFQ
jgi:hypothetical protein